MVCISYSYGCVHVLSNTILCQISTSRGTTSDKTRVCLFDLRQQGLSDLSYTVTARPLVLIQRVRSMEVNVERS